MKRVLSMLLAALFLLTALPLGAVSVSADTLSYLVYRIVDGEAHITGYYDELPTALVIPSVIEGCPVTAVIEAAFGDCSSLQSVVFPDTMSDIGLTSFAGCTSLKTITLPKSVVRINDSAFYRCTALTDVYYGGSEADRAAISISDENDPLLNATWHYNYTPAPEADSTLTIYEAIVLGESQEHNTYTPNKYYITGTIYEVHNTTYGNMHVMDEDGNLFYVYGTYSADGSVRYDSMDAKPESGDTVTLYGVIGQYNGIAQMRNAWVVSADSEPSFDGYIINGDFETGDKTGWTLWQDTAVTADAAYTGSYGLHLQGNGGWGGMAEQTFAVESGKSYALSMWLNVQSVGVNILLYDGDGNRIDVDWKGTSGWNRAEYTFTAPTDTVRLVFAGCGNSTAESVYVDDVALHQLQDTSYLLYENIHGEVTITGYTDDLPADLVIPDTIEGCPVTTIGYCAFAECKSLTSVVIPDSVTSIEAGAFDKCSSLTSVVIPNSVTAIGGSAFSGCSSLASVVIPTGVTIIETYAFAYCRSMTAIVVDENNAYYSSLNGVLFNKDQTALIQYPGGKDGAYTIPDSVITIEDCAFENNDVLTSVTIGDSVTTIGERAFMFCDALATVTIPVSVNVVEHDAFYGCDVLTDVYYGGSEADRDAISISSYNDPLLKATWYYAKSSCNHEYFYPCDPVCMLCYEITNPDAAHNVLHVEAKAPTCTENGNIEYWYCDLCGTAWADDCLIMQTNLLSVILPMAEHAYDNDYDADCNYCGEWREVEQPVVQAATIVFDADKTQRVELTTSKQVWQQGTFTVTNNKASSTSNVADYSNPVRFYTSSEVVIAYPGMTAFMVDVSPNYKTAWGNTLATAGLSYTEEDGVFTVRLTEPTDSITLTCTSQVRVYSITVTSLESELGEDTCQHQYFYPCDPVCMLCYEITNPDAAHNLFYVESLVPTCTEDGHIEYWYCADCGSVWADEALTLLTTLKNVIVPAPGHEYDNDSDPDCNYCGEWREVEQPVVQAATIVFDADKTQRVELTTSKQVWQQGYFTVTNNKASSTSNVSDYSNPVRFYTNSEVVIAYPGMTAFMVDASGAASNYQTAWGNTLTVAGLSYTEEDGVFTVRLTEPTDSITLTCTSQVRAYSITVTSLESELGEGCTHVYDDAFDAICNTCGAVREVEWPVDRSITIVFDGDKTQRVEYTTSQQVWQQGYFTVTNNKASSATNVSDYSNPVRFYKSSEVVIAYPGMTAFVVDASGAASNYRTAWGNTLTAAGLSYTEEDGIYTVRLIEPTDSITLTCTAQVRAYSIAVTSLESELGGDTCQHQYFYPCDPVCMLCYELTNPDATHNIVHVEAKEPTCYENGNIEYWYCDLCGGVWLDEACSLNSNIKAVILPVSHHLIYVESLVPTCTEDGNVEYWYCSDCGSMWLDEECTINTNLSQVYWPATGHIYDDDYDPDCNYCGEWREVGDLLMGDLDGNGRITMVDLALLQRYLNGWDIDLNLSAADVNGDGKVNVRDLSLLQRYLNGWDVTLG